MTKKEEKEKVLLFVLCWKAIKGELNNMMTKRKRKSWLAAIAS